MKTAPRELIEGVNFDDPVERQEFRLSVSRHFLLKPVKDVLAVAGMSSGSFYDAVRAIADRWEAAERERLETRNAA